MKKHMRKGFSLTEIIVAITLIGILTVLLTVSLNSYFNNQKLDRCENELRLMINDFNAYMIDYGNIELEPNDPEFDIKIEDIMMEFNRGYSSYEVDIDSIEITENSGLKTSIKMHTKVKKDPWGEYYTIEINTDSSTPQGGTVVVYSSGPDTISESSNYKNGVMGDDMILVISPRNVE